MIPCIISYNKFVGFNDLIRLDRGHLDDSNRNKFGNLASTLAQLITTRDLPTDTALAGKPDSSRLSEVAGQFSDPELYSKFMFFLLASNRDLRMNQSNYQYSETSTWDIYYEIAKLVFLSRASVCISDRSELNLGYHLALETFVDFCVDQIEIEPTRFGRIWSAFEDVVGIFECYYGVNSRSGDRSNDARARDFITVQRDRLLEVAVPMGDMKPPYSRQNQGPQSITNTVPQVSFSMN